jgi:calcineurin-like phosphoesterase family protein
MPGPPRGVPDTPEEILRLPPEEADRFLGELERTVPRRAAFLPLAAGGLTAAYVFGDTHGDWRSVEEAYRRFEGAGRSACLVGLGDYIDRTPTDCGAGSVANALFLLSRAAKFPERVFLLQGNHETTRRIGVMPHTLPDELEGLWGPSDARYDRLMGLLERGPLAASTASGAYLAHAGFPRGKLPNPWSRALDTVDDEQLAEIVWAECGASNLRRGAAEAWSRDDLEQFLSASGLSLVIRGHDPDLAGRAVFGGKVVTLHTTRVYERYGGVVVAKIPLDRPVRTVDDLELERLSTEGKRFPAPR